MENLILDAWFESLWRVVKEGTLLDPLPDNPAGHVIGGVMGKRYFDRLTEVLDEELIRNTGSGLKKE